MGLMEMIAILDQDARDWGVGAWDAGAAARALAACRPATIDSAEDYAVRAMGVYRRASGADAPHVDWRLVAPLWRVAPVAPREWREGGRAHEWLAYWEAVAFRPGTVGSSYNPSPDAAARAWRHGVPARWASLFGASLDAVMLSRGGWRGWRGGRERLLALVWIARKLRASHGQGQDPGLAALAELRTADLRTADLRRLARLSGATLRAIVPCAREGRMFEGGAVDWARLAPLVAQVAAAPRDLLKASRIPATHWLGWHEMPADDKFRAQLGQPMHIGHRLVDGWLLAAILVADLDADLDSQIAAQLDRVEGRRSASWLPLMAPMTRMSAADARAERGHAALLESVREASLRPLLDRGAPWRARVAGLDFEAFGAAQYWADWQPWAPRACERAAAERLALIAEDLPDSRQTMRRIVDRERGPGRGTAHARFRRGARWVFDFAPLVSKRSRGAKQPRPRLALVCDENLLEVEP